MFRGNLSAREVLVGSGGLDDGSSMPSQKNHGGGNMAVARFPSGAAVPRASPIGQVRRAAVPP
jgi:hypothetical protein